MNYKLHLILAGILVTLTACSSEEPMPKGDPSSKIKSSMRGYSADHGVVAGRDATSYWMQQIVSGYNSKNYRKQPAKLTQIDTHRSCNIERTTVDQNFLNGFVGNASAYSQVYNFDQETFYKRANDIVKRIKSGVSVATIRMAPKRLKGVPIVDVVITASSKPVYLVLNAKRTVVWNFHIHNNIVIDRVVILSEGNTGVMNLDESVPVTILDGEALKRCKILPARKPAAHWRFVKQYKKNKGSFEDVYKKNVNYHNKYNRWFLKQFGYHFESNIVGFSDVNHLLFGPVPPTRNSRVPYNSIEGANVRITKSDHVLIGSKAEATEYFKQRQIETINVSHSNLLK